MAHGLDRNSGEERQLSDDERLRSDTKDDGLSDETHGLDRRSFMRTGLTVAALGVATAGAGVASAATVRGIPFDRVLDAVDDLGMDPSGSSPIDGALEAAMESNTLVEFPPGEYLVTEEHVARGIDNFGVRGTGSSPSDVKFVFPDGNAGAPDPSNYVLFWLEAGRGILLENFELHQTDDRRTAASIVAWAGDDLEIHDVVWQGFNPIASYAKGTCCYPSVTTTDGVGRISNVTIRDGGVLDTYPNRRMGILAQGNHVGELRFTGLDIREMGSTAIRATRCPGAVRITDSYFENNDNSSLRFGGGDHPSKRSWAKNCRVVVDRSRLQHLDSGEEYEGIEACRIDSNGQGWTGALVEGCEFVFRSLPTDTAYSRGAIARPGWGDHGGFTVRDTTIQVDPDNVPAVYAPTPGGDANQPHGVVLENVHVTGSQSSNDRGSVVRIDDSDGSVVENSCIHVPNGSVDGVAIGGSRDCRVAYTDILVGRDATSFTDSQVDTVGLTNDGACRVPGEKVTDDDQTLPNELVVRGTGERGNYSFDVTGDLRGEGLESWDDLSGSTAEGWVTETTDVDTFRFEGDVSRFEMLTGSVDLTLNGEATTIAALTGETDESGDGGTNDGGSDEPEGSVLRIRGLGTKTNYEFHVSGTLEADPDADDLERWDDLGETSANGWVTTETQVDTFRFTGEVLAFQFLEGNAEVTVDGESVDPTTLGPANTLEIWGYDAEKPSVYELATEGDVYSNPLAGSQGPEETSGGGAEGAVGDAVHSFRFDGSVTFFSLDGSAAVYLNGEQVDPAALVDGATLYPNTIVLDGTGSGGTTYEFAVDGEVVRSPDLGSAETADAVEGGVVRGSVDDDVDGFRFDGTLRSLVTDGGAAVNFGDSDD